ncbi:MAG: 5-methyltetrahydropteroyltriglutamate--homocysteine methyltransferase [Chloroflexota bacterium]|nr:5-methyltetrahydropteroyltriglutamate--homocysteine methyltransferase [Chloroflexota bacterium]
MILTSNLGYPRIGLNRELKFAQEKYWKNAISLDELKQTANRIQTANWIVQKEMGLDYIPSNDFSFYDQMLDTTVMLGAIPPRFKEGDLKDLDLYFAMARGWQDGQGKTIAAMEMTKWFNTNYHYIVPEINAKTRFKLNAEKPIEAYRLAQTLNLNTRPVIIGPVTYLLLSKSEDPDFNPLSKLDKLLVVYEDLFKQLKAMDVKWIQLDEPFLSLDLDGDGVDAYRQLFSRFTSHSNRPRIMLTSYFGDLFANRELVAASPFEGLHIDMTHCSQPEKVLASMQEGQTVSLGLIDGRNVWKNDLTATLDRMRSIYERFHFENMVISPSCSMLHVPQDVRLEKDLPGEVYLWLAFARQKLEELSELKKAGNRNFTPTNAFRNNQGDVQSRREIAKVEAAQHSAAHKAVSTQRKSPYAERKLRQQAVLNLPALPTTTIGSFPQTTEVRKLRSQLHKNAISSEQYVHDLEQETERTIRFQEKVGLDVLVHGEFERNDMVQYFAEKMEGFVFTDNGWVQSFGSRCVRPPIIYGAVSRPEPMTVRWATFAQSLTDKPVKGMLTGPVTILQWSFVRDDQPRSETCRQIAYAIRAEVNDLEAAGIKVIQIDEPALREGLPLQKKDWPEYLDWAVECFQIASSGVQDETQIHTHMCYAEFNDIIEAIAKMDADVISIEASRSKMELLRAFQEFNYPNEIGPGVYDIHSPNIPAEGQIEELIHSALKVIPADQLWINPDCGLKTRQWAEVEPALQNMLTAVQKVRAELAD